MSLEYGYSDITRNRERRPTPDDYVVPGKAATVIVEALRAAGAAGLSGAELNKKVMDAGLSGAAADKAKTRLKQARTVTQKDGRWRLGAQ